MQLTPEWIGYRAADESDGDFETMASEDPKGMIVRGVVARDVEAVVRLYNHYVAQTIITFEEEPVTVSEMSGRIDDIQLASLPWLVAERDNTVVGYAYATKWRARQA